MKARYIASKTETEKVAIRIAREEIERQKREVCSTCEDRIGRQVLAVTLKVLHDEFGFGVKRLETVRKGVENLFYLCEIDGERFSAVQAVDWLRDAMGIDLERDKK